MNAFYKLLMRQMEDHTISPEQLKQQLDSARESDRKMAEFKRMMEPPIMPLFSPFELSHLGLRFIKEEQHKPTSNYNDVTN